MSVANTMLDQIGGGKFIVMTGAKHFVGSDNSLMFSIPSRFSKNGINKVSITLEDSDTYTMRFYKIRGVKVAMIAESEGVYADQMQAIFTANTGLDTSL